VADGSTKVQCRAAIRLRACSSIGSWAELSGIGCVCVCVCVCVAVLVLIESPHHPVSLRTISNHSVKVVVCCRAHTWLI
jgi:hypothetical protein